jgi:hypothetical protein
MTTLRMTEATTLYTAGNNAGKGYEPGGATVDDAVTAMVADGGELILDRSTSDDVAVVIDSAGELVAIGGDATGGNAWAVTIVDAAEIEALKTAAGQAGDLAQVAICDRAMASDRDALISCAGVLADGAAQAMDR